MIKRKIAFKQAWQHSAIRKACWGKQLCQSSCKLHMTAYCIFFKPILLHSLPIENTGNGRQCACVLLYSKAKAFRVIACNNKQAVRLLLFSLRHEIAHCLISIPDMPQLIQCIFVLRYIRREFSLNLRTLKTKGIHINAIRRMIACGQDNMENLLRTILLLHIFINSAKQHRIRNAPGIATFIIDFISAMKLVEALSLNKLLDILPA